MAHLSHVAGKKKGAEFSEVQFAIGRHFYFLKFALPSKTQGSWSVWVFILCYCSGVLGGRKGKGFTNISILFKKHVYLNLKYTKTWDNYI